VDGIRREQEDQPSQRRHGTRHESAQPASGSVTFGHAKLFMYLLTGIAKLWQQLLEIERRE